MVENRDPWLVEVEPEALYGLAEVRSDRVLERIKSLIGNLANFPHYGRVYDPLYRAFRPQRETFVFYCDVYGVYYQLDEEQRKVSVVSVEDERGNPLARFGGINDTEPWE